MQPRPQSPPRDGSYARAAETAQIHYVLDFGLILWLCNQKPQNVVKFWQL